MIKAIRAEIRPTLTLAIPMICTQLLGFAQQIIDTVMSGHHSALTLAGVSLASRLFLLVYLLMSGIGIGFSAEISRYNGSGDEQAIRRTFQQGFWLFSLLGVLTIGVVVACAYAPYLFGSTADIAEQSRHYLLTLSLPAAVFIFACVARFFFEGMENPRTINMVQISLLPINILGNWIFLHYTDLGAQGMAIATGICHLLYGGFMFSTLYKSKRWRNFRLFEQFSKPDLRICRRLLMLGLPIGLALVIEAAMFSFLGIMASRESVIISGANQIALNYLGMMFMIPVGIAAALTIRCANALGRNDWTAIRNRAYAGYALSVLIMIISGMLMLLARHQIVAIYSNHKEMTALAAQILFVIAFFEPADGLQISSSGILRGLGDTRITLNFALISYGVIAIPLACLLAYVLDWGIIGLWAGCLLGLVIFAILGIRRVLLHINTHKEKV